MSTKLKSIKMRINDLLNVNRLINVISHRYTIGFISLVYLIGMFLWPLIAKPEWEYLQNVWDRWQSLNVGVLALISSIIVFKATKYHSEQARERQFIATRALLPDAMSELLNYCVDASKALSTLWYETESVHDCREFSVPYPEMPSKYQASFRDCISHAEKSFGTHLARIIANLQVFDSHLSSACKAENLKRREGTSRHQVAIMITLQSKICALTNMSFAHCRGLEDFQYRKLTTDDFEQAFVSTEITKFLDYDDINVIREMVDKALTDSSGIFSL